MLSFFFPVRTSGAAKAPSFAVQRAICLAVVSLTLTICGGALVMREAPLGKDPFVALDPVIMILAPASVLLALVYRSVAKRRAARLSGAQRAGMLFTSRLIPLAILEGGALIAAVAYYLGAPATPALVVMVALPLLMLGLVPLTDPDAAQQLELD